MCELVFSINLVMNVVNVSAYSLFTRENHALSMECEVFSHGTDCNMFDSRLPVWV